MPTIQFSYPSIPLASYFRADHLILHPLASYLMSTIYLSTRPSLWRVIFVPSIPWASYLHADHLILQPLASYFSCQSFNSPPIHPFGELFLCRPSLGRAIFVPTILFSILWRVIFALSSPWASYFRAYYLILHSLASYFRADHLTLHPSIPLASYFCTVQPLGELFSCLLSDSPSFCELFWC